MIVTLPYPFGTKVKVFGESFRIAGRVIDGVPTYRQTQDVGRYRSWKSAWSSEGWPGHRIDEDWAEAIPSFLIEPDLKPDTAFVRMRRFPLMDPASGILVGATSRKEGTIGPGANGPGNKLLQPLRIITFVEVAVPTRGGRCDLLLAHLRDVRKAK